jgi:hypothetical protein
MFRFSWFWKTGLVPRLPSLFKNGFINLQTIGMKKSIKQPTLIKSRTEDVYYYHVVGSETTYRYDVKRNMMQFIIAGKFNSEMFAPMTYEEFENDCRFMFIQYVQKLRGWN